MMRRLVRKPSFWVALIVASFALNVFLAVATLHRHIRYYEYPEDEAYHFSSFFSSRSRMSDTASSYSSSSSSSSSSFTTPQIPESVLWRRMLKQDLSASGCGQQERLLESSPRRSSDATAITGTETDDSSLLLPPFGFRRQIQQFVESSSSSSSSSSTLLRGGTNQGRIIHQEWKNTTTTTMTTTSNPNHHYPTCFLPPATACAETQYSVIMYSRAQNLRRLLLNLMAFQSYPSVHDITLIVLPSLSTNMATTTTTTTKDPWDTPYGSRILDWKLKGTIQMIFVAEQQQQQQQSSPLTTLWDSIVGVGQQLQQQLLRPAQESSPSSAILWVDGDARKDWNGTMFRTNFRIWRQHSRALVVASAMTRMHPPHDADDDSSSSSYSLTSSSSSCPDHHHLDRAGLHGTLMHRQWLCFLQHPVLGSLGDFLKQDDGNDAWDTTLKALAILWNQLGEGHIIQTAAAKAATKTTTSSLNHHHHHLASKRVAVAVPSTTATMTTKSTSRMQTILDYFGGCSCSVVNTIVIPTAVGTNDNFTTCQPRDQGEA